MKFHLHEVSKDVCSTEILCRLTGKWFGSGSMSILLFFVRWSSLVRWTLWISKGQSSFNYLWRDCRDLTFVWILVRTASFPRSEETIHSAENKWYLTWKPRFFLKISWIGWRNDWCEGHWCGSSYMVVRLSDISPFIWGIIYFCNMDGLFRILEKRLLELICTQLYMPTKRFAHLQWDHINSLL